MKLSISHRIMLSFLILATASLSALGLYLLSFFYQQNLESKTAHLVTNAKIIGKSLEISLSEPQQTNKIHGEIKKISAVTDLRITILDPSGNVTADSWEEADGLDNHLDRREIQGAFHNEYATAIRYSATIAQNMLYVAVPVYSGDKLAGIVRTATTLLPIESSYQQIRSFILTAIALDIFLTIAMGGALAYYQARPIKEMIAAAKKIAGGDLACRIRIQTKDELEILAHTINQLTSNLEDKIGQIDAEAKKLALILENMDNAVILFDIYGNVSAMNASAKEIFSITSEMLGKHSISVLGDSILTQTAQDVLSSKTNCSIHFKLKKSEAPKTFQVFFAPIASQESHIAGVLTVFHDISALQGIYDRQTEFVANASHELKTPLTAIKGFSETLLDGAIENPALSKKFIATIHAESERMSRLIEDLLHLAKLEAPDYKKQIKLEKIRLAEIFRAAQARLAPQLQEKKQQLRLELPETEITLKANYDWILRLIINLAENAIKYTPEEGVITLAAQTDGGFARVSVKDNGIGIAPGDLPFIFERFYRADKARSRACGGSGLGLSLARFIVEMFDGKITAESKQGGGTTFTFTLPLAH